MPRLTVVYGATHRLHPTPLWSVRVSDNEDGDGLTFAGKQHLRVGNYIVLGTLPSSAIATRATPASYVQVTQGST